jgi:hypothetical protein
MRGLNIHPRWFIFFPFERCVRIYCFNCFVPICFQCCSLGSQWVPYDVPPIPKGVPGNTSFYPISFAQKFSPSHLYWQAKEDALHPYIEIAILGSLQVSVSFWVVGQSKGPIAKKKPKKKKNTWEVAHLKDRIREVNYINFFIFM